MIELIAALGVEVEWRGQTRCACEAADVIGTKLDPELCTRIRASILLAGPLLARFGSADVPPPGGDVIGRRRVDTHLMAFAALGADVEVDREYRLRAPHGLAGRRDPPRRGQRHRHRERADGRRRVRRGTTVIMNAACEPHVQDLCRMLVQDGRRHRGDRLERAGHRRRRRAARLHAPDRRRPHRGGLVHRPGGGHRRRPADRGRRRRAPARHPPQLLAGWASRSRW